MNVRKKLDAFTNIVLQEAEQSRKEMLSEMNRQVDAACAEAERAARRQAEERLRVEQLKAEQLKNRDIIRASTNARKGLLTLRNKLTDEVFEAVTQKLRAFAQTSAYEDYLTQVAARLKAQNQGQAIILTFCADDMPVGRRVAQSLQLQAQETDEDIIGGLRALLPDKNAIIDESFATRLQKERSSFSSSKAESLA